MLLHISAACAHSMRTGRCASRAPGLSHQRRQPMRMITTFALSATLVLSLGCGPRQRATGLANEKDINNGLLVLRPWPRKFSANATALAARMFKARAYAKGLKDVAEDRGYSDGRDRSLSWTTTPRRRKCANAATPISNPKAPAIWTRTACVSWGTRKSPSKSQIGALLRAK